jgi:hypothetical protein
MAQIVKIETVNATNTLVQELRAIDQWDIDYRRRRRREPYETAAYLSRQRRRIEIMRALKASDTGL